MKSGRSEERCSRETAQKIVDILRAEQESGDLIALISAKPKLTRSRSGQGVKFNEEARKFVLEQRGTPLYLLQQRLKEQFGVTCGKTIIYRIWRGGH